MSGIAQDYLPLCSHAIMGRPAGFHHVISRLHPKQVRLHPQYAVIREVMD
jgi:hypothetical protein